MKRRPQIPQPVSQELRDNLLAFIRTKFYQNQPVEFAKQTRDLLRWVVLWPATWFTRRGVTVLGTEYHRILTTILLDALTFQRAEKITYLPAYLRQVIESHFSHHGDELYEAAKNVRTITEQLTENALKSTGKAPDPVRELAQAARLLKPLTKTAGKRPKNDQLTLL